MIEAKSSTEQVRRVYNLWSSLYGPLAEPFEKRAKLMALEKAAIQPHDKVLEVAVGPGKILLQILSSVDSTNTVQGVDLSPKMIAHARRLATTAGYANFELQEADARHLPFTDDTFDVLYNSYMLDLIPLADLRIVLQEFRRVLKPGGRLVLVNMSKARSDESFWIERLYRRVPGSVATYVLGGWAGLATIVMVLRVTQVAGRETGQVSYYLSSLPLQAKRIAQLIRQHWSIESQLHWVLDVTFTEDASRIRQRHAPQTSAMLRRLAVSILSSDTSLKDSLRGKRYRACLSTDTLERILLSFVEK